MEHVPLLDVDGESGGKILHATVVSSEQLHAWQTRLPSCQTEWNMISPSRDQRQAHVAQKTNLPNDSIAPPEQTISAGVPTNRKRLKSDGKTLLQNLRIGEP